MKYDLAELMKIALLKTKLKDKVYGVDFDDTLNYVKCENKFCPNEELVEFLKDKSFYIITARRGSSSNKSYLNDFCKEYNIKPIDVFYTAGELKSKIIEDEDLNINIFIDDNDEQKNDVRSYSNKIDVYDPMDFFNNLDHNNLGLFRSNLDYGTRND